MNQSQWDTLLDVVEGRRLPQIPTAFIADCPWLPGWANVSTLDYFADDRCWFEANCQAIEMFPDTIFLPGYWAEYGMCTEPSAFGAKCQWFENNMPHAEKILSDLSEVDTLRSPNVRIDGLLPFVINRLKRMEPNIAGNQTKAAKVLGISDRTLRDRIHRYRKQGCMQLA